VSGVARKTGLIIGVVLTCRTVDGACIRSCHVSACYTSCADIVRRAVGALRERTDPAALLTRGTGSTGIKDRSETSGALRGRGTEAGRAVSGVAGRADIVGRVVLACGTVDGAGGRSGCGEMVSSLAGETGSDRGGEDVVTARSTSSRTRGARASSSSGESDVERGSTGGTVGGGSSTCVAIRVTASCAGIDI